MSERHDISNGTALLILFLAAGIVVAVYCYNSPKIWPQVVRAMGEKRLHEGEAALDQTLDKLHQEGETDREAELEEDRKLIAAKNRAIIACEKRGGTAVMGFGFKAVCLRASALEELP